jgi:hypothetical protein
MAPQGAFVSYKGLVAGGLQPMIRRKRARGGKPCCARCGFKRIALDPDREQILECLDPFGKMVIRVFALGELASAAVMEVHRAWHAA